MDAMEAATDGHDRLQIGSKKRVDLVSKSHGRRFPPDRKSVAKNWLHVGVTRVSGLLNKSSRRLSILKITSRGRCFDRVFLDIGTTETENSTILQLAKILGS